MNLKSIFKGVVSSTLAVGLITGVSTSPIFAQSTESSSESYATESGVIQPYSMDIGSGTHSGSAFTDTYKLSSSNGKTVNFWINNTGNVNVKITINGGSEATFAPGQSGHISASVTGIFASNYTFKAVPTPNGGSIKIEYKIAQRD